MKLRYLAVISTGLVFLSSGAVVLPQGVASSPAASAESSPVRELSPAKSGSREISAEEKVKREKAMKEGKEKTQARKTEAREINKTNREPIRGVNPKAKHSVDETLSSKKSEKKVTEKKPDEPK